LLALSVLLAIIAGIVYMSRVSGVAVLATPNQAATQQKMNAIEDALMQFRAANDRLPCPPEDFVAEQLNRLQPVHLGRHRNHNVETGLAPSGMMARPVEDAPVALGSDRRNCPAVLVLARCSHRVVPSAPTLLFSPQFRKSQFSRRLNNSGSSCQALEDATDNELAESIRLG
jgi:hypothetical protein